MTLLKLIPVFWILIWSMYALRYAFRRESTYTWGVTGKRPAPVWVGRLLFVSGAAYGLLWAIVTGGGDLGYIQPTSTLASVLNFINTHIGLLLINALLAIGFLAFAFSAMQSLRQGSNERWSRTTAVALSLGSGLIGVYALM